VLIDPKFYVKVNLCLNFVQNRRGLLNGVLIALKNKILSEGLKALLQGEKDVEIWESNEPPQWGEYEVLVTDWVTLKENHASFPLSLKVLLLDTGLHSSEVFEALWGYGVKGILPPYMDIKLFLKAITKVREGEVWLDQTYLKVLLDGHRREARSLFGLLGLSKREKEVAVLVAQGLSNKEVAKRLSVTERTVKVHLNHIFKKLNIKSRMELLLLLGKKE